MTPRHLKEEFIKEIRPLAVPWLYRCNPFHIFQMPISAELREFSKSKKRLEFMIENGQDVTQAYHGLWWLTKEITRDDLEIAFDLVQDPRKRVIQEFFWVWDDTTKEVMKEKRGKALLSQNVQYWRERYEETHDPISRHNYTILSHALALEEELEIIEGINRNPDCKRLQRLWEECYQNYLLLDKDERFWEIFYERVEAKREPLLTEQFVEDFRSSFFQFLYLIHTKLMIESVGKGFIREAERHASLIKTIRLGKLEKEKLVEEEVYIYSSRIEKRCHQAQSNIAKDPVHADRILEDLFESSRNELQLLKFLLSDSSLRLMKIHETILDVYIEGLEKYLSEVEDIARIREILPLLWEIAISQDLKDRVDEFLNKLKNYEQHGNFWHAAGYFEQPPELLSVLEKAREECKEGRVEEAINLLTAFIRKSTYLTEDSQNCLKVALAYCFTQLGWQYIKKIDQILKEANEIVVAIMANVERFGVFAMVNSNKCNACRTDLFYRYIIVIDDNEFPVCSSCFEKLKNIENRRLSLIQKTLKNSYDALFTAVNLNHANKVASKFMELVIEEAKDRDISLGTPKAIFSFPKLPTTPPILPDSDSTKLASQIKPIHANYYMNLIGLFLVAMVVLGIMLWSVSSTQSYETGVSLNSPTTGAPTITEGISHLSLETATILPSELASISTPIPLPRIDFSIMDAAFRDNYLFLADANQGLRVIEIIGNSYNQVAQLALSGNPSSIVLNSDYAYITFKDGGLKVINVADPKAPIEVGSYLSARSARSIFINGEYAYLADGLDGVQVLNILTPSEPQRVTVFDTEGEAFDLAGYKNTLLLADGWAGLSIFDISNPSIPQSLGRHYPIQSFKGIATDGRYAYLADSFAGLSIIDVAQPTEPKLLNNYNLSQYSAGFGEAVDVALSGSLLLLLDSQFNSILFDISNPPSPVAVSPKNETVFGYPLESLKQPYKTETAYKPTPIVKQDRPIAVGCTLVYLNVRKGDNTSYLVLGVVPEGQCFNILGRNSDASWLYIQYTGDSGLLEGWVSSEYTRLEGNISLIDLPLYLSP